MGRLARPAFFTHREHSPPGGTVQGGSKALKDEAEFSNGEAVMSINCTVILRWAATPEQLKELGDALWRWCIGPAGGASTYELLDNQALADLAAGKLPASSSAERRGVPFKFRDELSAHRHGSIARLRREIPADGLEDVLVDGKSWDLADDAGTEPWT
jgi:hypothetical protein